MVVYCKCPYGDIIRWCRSKGYTERPRRLYNQNDRPLLVVDNRIEISCHDKCMEDFDDITEYIEQSKGENILFGLRGNAIDYIGDKSLVIWSKK